MTDGLPRKRLLILSFSPIATDARVLKQVRHFIGDYEVTTCGYGNDPDGVSRHIRIPDSLPARQFSRPDLIFRRYRHIYRNTPAIAYAQNALREADEFDIVLANDVDAVGLALSLNPRLGVHADIHEYAPGQNEELAMWRYFVAPYVRWLCRAHLTGADSVTTVSQGIADKYKREFGVTASVVTNAAPYAELNPTDVGDQIKLVHSGVALRNRGLDQVVAAVAGNRSVTLDLYLMPNDPEYLAELRNAAAQTTNVAVHEPVPYADLVTTLNGFDVGVHVIPPVNFNYEWALPNKFFDSVQARQGMIVGPSPEMARTLREYGLGAVTDGFSAQDIRAVVESLTVSRVTEWKANANAAARALSSVPQIEVWEAAIRAIASRHRRERLPDE